MKQTAVEYLVEQLFPKALSTEQYYHIEKAKEMEKQQNSNKKYSEDELKLYGEFCVSKFNRFDKVTLQNEYFEEFKKIIDDKF